MNISVSLDCFRILLVFHPIGSDCSQCIEYEQNVWPVVIVDVNNVLLLLLVCVLFTIIGQT